MFTKKRNKKSLLIYYFEDGKIAMYIDDFEEDDIQKINKDIGLSFVCEDCDYKWDDENDYDTNINNICPMCGSENTLEITE